MRRCELAISDVEVSATNTACIDLDPYLIAAKRRPRKLSLPKGSRRSL